MHFAFCILYFGINKINGVLGGDENIFWREKKYKGDWHSAYTSIKNIKDMASKKGFAAETEHRNSINYSDSYITPDSDTAANEVTLKYSYKYTTGYIYKSEKGVYEKTIDGKPHVLQSGETTQFKNIIIELIADTSLGDGSDRRNINTTGSGKGYYITGGLAEEITWSKPSRRENTVYKKLDGTPLVINPGKTIINIIIIKHHYYEKSFLFNGSIPRCIDKLQQGITVGERQHLLRRQGVRDLLHPDSHHTFRNRYRKWRQVWFIRRKSRR